MSPFEDSVVEALESIAKTLKSMQTHLGTIAAGVLLFMVIGWGVIFWWLFR